MQEMRQSSVTLVLGGVRSGKSRYAQQLAERERRVVFVATARASDDEMQRKIERHREERPVEWTTVEEPLELVQVLAQHGERCDVMVVDCLTIFAANLLDAEGDDQGAVEINQNVARVADDVVLMVAGLPLALKGHLEVTL